MSEETLFAWLYHALNAVAAPAAKRTRHLLKPRQSAPFRITVKGTVAGEKIGESFEGRMHVCPDSKYQAGPTAQEMLAAVLSVVSKQMGGRLSLSLPRVDWAMLKETSPASVRRAGEIINEMRRPRPKRGGVKFDRVTGEALAD